MNECKRKYDMIKYRNIRSLNILKILPEEDKTRFGCVLKCFYERMGTYRKGRYDTDYFARSLPNNVATEVLSEKMEKCQNDTNQKYGLKDRFSCRYFFDFDICIDTYY